MRHSIITNDIESFLVFLKALVPLIVELQYLVLKLFLCLFRAEFLGLLLQLFNFVKQRVEGALEVLKVKMFLVNEVAFSLVANRVLFLDVKVKI